MSTSYTMPSTSRCENYRINVEVEQVYARTGRRSEHDYKMLELEEVKKSILRHVDGVDSAQILWDTIAECVHCHCPVEDAMTDDGPGCCDEAVAEYEAWTEARP